jgi:hypothetical protein
MSIKLKALGLGLLAMIAASAFAAMNATAETGGHFTSDSPNKKTTITATEEQGTSHHTVFEVEGLGGITCKHVLYEGTFEGETVTSVRLTPTYTHCTTVGTATAVTVDPNECGFEFFVAKKITTKHSTVKILCKGATKYIAVTHPECEIRIPEQTLTGISYATTLETKHTITATATVGTEALPKITTHFEKGFCVLLGTTHPASFSGSVTVKGFEDKGNDATHPYGIEGGQVNITATSIE